MEQSEAVEILEDLLREVVTCLVDHEDTINIKTLHNDSLVMFDVDVDKTDVGKLIGRHGKTAGAIRLIMGAASAKLNMRSQVTIPDKKNER